MRKKLLHLQTTIHDIKTFIAKSPIAIVLSGEIVLGIALTVLSFILFAKLSDNVLDKEKIIFDSFFTHLIVSLRHPFLTQVMIFISFLGAGGILVSSGVILCILIIKKHKKEALIFSAIVLMGAVINIILKLVIQRPRPIEAPLVIINDYSFPSTHSMYSFVFFITIAYFTYHFTKSTQKSIIVSLFCGVLVFLIGVSRVYLGVHYPSDVLGGYLAGFLWFTIVIMLDRTIVLYRYFRESS